MASHKTSMRRLALLLAVLQPSFALDLPDTVMCSDTSVVDFDKCGVDGNTGTRSMEQIPHISVPIPHWWEAMPEYQKQCENCTDIWMLCPSEDTGGWDGGDAMRIGSMMMLERINKQQWLLPGYELRCEWYNDNCAGYTGQSIVSAKLDENREKYVAIGTSGCSGVCGHIARYTQHYNMPMMSWAAGMPDLTDRTLFRNFFRTRIPHTAFTYAWLQMARICAWKNIVLIMAEEARFRGHYTLMQETIAAEPDMNVVFEAQILSPLVQTDAVVQTIKDNRYRIIQMITYETTWRAMMCSANSLGASGLVWMVYGFYNKGFYGSLNDPDLSQWSCDKATLRKMSNNAIFATSFMWATDREHVIDCDKDKALTTTAFIDEYWDRAKSLTTDKTLALGGRNYDTSNGGALPRDAGAQAADGACLYAMALSKLLGFQPDGLAATLNYASNNTYNLSQLQQRSPEAYEDMNQLLQSASFYGVSNSPFEFQCDNLPDDRICDEACRNSKGCTGDAKGETIVFQFDSSGTEGVSDGSADNSEFPTIAEGRVESYTWKKALKFDYGGYWGGDSSSTMLASIPYYQQTCVDGYHKVTNTEFCVPDDMLPECPEGLVLLASGFCGECPAGTMYSVVGEGASAQVFCIACPAGTMCEKGGCLGQCDSCAPGTFQNETGQATCTPCPVGTAAGSPASVACSKCQPGQFAPQEEMDSCASCPIGTAQPAEGQASCEECPAGRTTFENSASLFASCLCMEGTMEPVEPNLTDGDVADFAGLATCQACPEGFTCPLGSAYHDALGENHELRGYEEPNADLVIVPVSRPNMGVSEGYYLAADYQGSAGTESEKLALNIYLCDGLGIQVLSQDGYVSPCPGGPADACDNGREGIACAKCAAGSYTTIDGPCAECDGWEAVILMLVILAGFTAVVASYYFINGPLTAKLSPLMVLAMCAGTFVMTMQSCAALASLSISFPDGLGGLFAGTRLFALDLRALRPECTLGSSVIASYALKVGLPWFLFALFGVLCFLSQLLPERMRWEKSKTFNTVCNFFQAAFITIVLTVVGPFRTFEHPGSGDRSSMLSSPDIDTSSGTYAGLVVFAVFGLLPCVLFIALYVASVKRSPNWRGRASTLHNLQAIKFVLFRFEAHAYYWGLCFLARSTAVSIITLLNNPFSQLLLLSVVMVVYLVALCLVWPWKAPVVNWLDALQTTLLIVILLAATRLVGTDNGGEDLNAVTGLISTCYVLLGLAFAVAGFLAVRGQLDLGDKTNQEADEIPGGESANTKIDGDKAVEVDETLGDKAADGDEGKEVADTTNEVADTANEVVVHLAKDEAASSHSV